MTVFIVVAIIAVMLFPVIGLVRSRLDRTKCAGNLRNLHVAAALYVQEHRSWPQILAPGSSGSPQAASRWIEAFRPYGLDQTTWVCPTIQRLLGGPDLLKEENRRIDYVATPFDAKPLTPYKWAKQPWFIEKGNMHGNGNLIIFPDGHIQSLYEIVSKPKAKSSK